MQLKQYNIELLESLQEWDSVTELLELYVYYILWCSDVNAMIKLFAISKIMTHISIKIIVTHSSVMYLQLHYQPY